MFGLGQMPNTFLMLPVHVVKIAGYVNYIFVIFNDLDKKFLKLRNQPG